MQQIVHSVRRAVVEIERRIQDEPDPRKESSHLGRCARRRREGRRECTSEGGGAGLGVREQPGQPSLQYFRGLTCSTWLGV